MKQFIVDRHTTPNTPTLEQVPTDKIPVYDSIDDATADLANLAENQIVATKDTGSELSAPVDVVQSGNMHGVTSNAVADSLSYSTTEQATGGKWIDGKPIYKKTFSWSGSSQTTVTIGHTDYKDNVIKMEGFGITDQLAIPLPYPDGTASWILTARVETSGSINIQNWGTQVLQKAYVTIYYTKPTD